MAAQYVAHVTFRETFVIELQQACYRSLLYNFNASGHALGANRRQTSIYFGFSWFT